MPHTVSEMALRVNESYLKAAEFAARVKKQVVAGQFTRVMLDQYVKWLRAANAMNWDFYVMLREDPALLAEAAAVYGDSIEASIDPADYLDELRLTVGAGVPSYGLSQAQMTALGDLGLPIVVPLAIVAAVLVTGVVTDRAISTISEVFTIEYASRTDSVTAMLKAAETMTPGPKRDEAIQTIIDKEAGRDPGTGTFGKLLLGVALGGAGWLAWTKLIKPRIGGATED